MEKKVELRLADTTKGWTPFLALYVNEGEVGYVYSNQYFPTQAEAQSFGTPAYDAFVFEILKGKDDPQT